MRPEKRDVLEERRPSSALLLRAGGGSWGLAGDSLGTAEPSCGTQPCNCFGMSASASTGPGKCGVQLPESSSISCQVDSGL